MFCCGNEDVFSPSQKEVANETICKDSRSMPEFFYENAHLLEKSTDFMAQKRYNLVEGVNSRNKVNGTKEQILLNIPKACEQNNHVVLAKNYVPFKNFEEIHLGVSLDKDIPMEICIPDYKISFPSKRNQSSCLSEKDYQELSSPKIVNTAYKCKQTKPCFLESTQNSVPFEKRRNKEQMIDKLVIANSQYPANNLLKCSEKKEIEVIDLETMELCDNDGTKTYSAETSDDVQTLSTGSELNCIQDERQKRTASECNYKETNECFSSFSNYSIQQHQIQANIIEQLIKDTVGFEFDAIRQLLYLQHVLLLRHLQQNLEVFESHNSLNSEFILKIIEELMQQNKLLKKAVIANQRRT